MWRNLVKTIEIWRFEKNHREKGGKKVIFKLRSFVHEVKSETKEKSWEPFNVSCAISIWHPKAVLPYWPWLHSTTGVILERVFIECMHGFLRELKFFVGVLLECSLGWQAFAKWEKIKAASIFPIPLTKGLKNVRFAPKSAV